MPSRPLCPAGHLPHKEGDRWRDCFRQFSVLEKAPTAKLLISPHVGEISGRTEGGAVPLPSQLNSQTPADP
ncbi:hypothetical protein FJV76_32395 [Mesorhizobium sp. WSM4303]|nr:hypothetical protein FJV76_32395 [Mesorhizobium sp. WSM4303]TRC97200.1 hypothetical protein FJV77_11690 [Mesorhizobium sp. WSM4306]